MRACLLRIFGPFRMAFPRVRSAPCELCCEPGCSLALAFFARPGSDVMNLGMLHEGFGVLAACASMHAA